MYIYRILGCSRNSCTFLTFMCHSEENRVLLTKTLRLWVYVRNELLEQSLKTLKGRRSEQQEQQQNVRHFNIKIKPQFNLFSFDALTPWSTPPFPFPVYVSVWFHLPNVHTTGLSPFYPASIEYPLITFHLKKNFIQKNSPPCPHVASQSGSQSASQQTNGRANRTHTWAEQKTNNKNKSITTQQTFKIWQCLLYSHLTLIYFFLAIFLFLFLFDFSLFSFLCFFRIFFPSNPQYLIDGFTIHNNFPLASLFPISVRWRLAAEGMKSLRWHGIRSHQTSWLIGNISWWIASDISAHNPLWKVFISSWMERN